VRINARDRKGDLKVSVQTFGVDELANVAAAIINGKAPQFRASDAIHRVCKALAKVSEANVACFNDRYSHKGVDETPTTWEEIEKAISSDAGIMRCDLTRAHSTVSLLHYNCDDSGGDFTLKIEGAHEALISVLEGMNEALARKAGIDW
jgi:hypothetical protein